MHKPLVLTLLLLAFTAWSARAQDLQAVSEPATVVLRPTIPAYFPGCGHEPEGTTEKANCSAGKLMSFIANNLRYPDEAREARIEGVVVLSFIVSELGVVEQPRLLRDIGGGCGAEAIRVLNAMPHWQPAIYKGAAVATQFTLPITFGLKTGMFDYVLHLGNLEDGEVSRDELVEAVTSGTPRVTDPKGAELTVAELVYTFERGGERKELITRGTELPDEKAFSKWLGRKPGRLTVEANAVEGLDIRTVSKGFLVIR